jgi:hypothetical protein
LNLLSRLSIIGTYISALEVLVQLSLLRVTLFLLVIRLSPTAQAHALDVPTTLLEGAWKENTGKQLCYFHGNELVTFDHGETSILGIEHFSPDGQLSLRREGKLERWQASVHGQFLALGKNGDVRDYRRLAEIPSEVEMQPFLLGKFRPLPPDQVRRIQQEVERRWRLDQAVRMDPAMKILEPLVDKENRAYLFYLLHQVGWLDVARFGTRTSVFATLLVKHFSSLSVNLSVLPFVEHDLRLTGEGQVFAILFDDTMLHIGRKQWFGTQMDEDAQGRLYVLPIDQPQRVDERLKEIGELPLDAYLSQASQYLNNGKPIRRAYPDE